MLDQRLHTRHIRPRIAVGHKLDVGCFAQQYRRRARTVALHEKTGIDRVRVVGPVIHVPEIIADQSIVGVAGETTVDLRQQVVHARVHHADAQQGRLAGMLQRGGFALDKFHRRVEPFGLAVRRQIPIEADDTGRLAVLAVIDATHDLRIAAGIQRHQQQRIAESVEQRTEESAGSAIALDHLEFDRGHGFQLQAKAGTDRVTTKVDLRAIDDLGAKTRRRRRASLPAATGVDSELEQPLRLPFIRHGDNRQHSQNQGGQRICGKRESHGSILNYSPDFYYISTPANCCTFDSGRRVRRLRAGTL